MKAILKGLAGLFVLTVATTAVAQDKPMPAAANEVTVRIDNFSFTPAEVIVTPQTTVTWVNGDDIPHTVVATGKAFRSKAMDTDQKFSVVMTAPGSYEYFCSLHPHMKGKVVVK